MFGLVKRLGRDKDRNMPSGIPLPSKPPPTCPLDTPAHLAADYHFAANDDLFDEAFNMLTALRGLVAQATPEWAEKKLAVMLLNGLITTAAKADEHAVTAEAIAKANPGDETCNAMALRARDRANEIAALEHQARVAYGQCPYAAATGAQDVLDKIPSVAAPREPKTPPRLTPEKLMVDALLFYQRKQRQNLTRMESVRAAPHDSEKERTESLKLHDQVSACTYAAEALTSEKEALAQREGVAALYTQLGEADEIERDVNGRDDWIDRRERQGWVQGRPNDPPEVKAFISYYNSDVRAGDNSASISEVKDCLSQLQRAAKGEQLELPPSAILFLALGACESVSITHSLLANRSEVSQRPDLEKAARQAKMCADELKTLVPQLLDQYRVLNPKNKDLARIEQNFKNALASMLPARQVLELAQDFNNTEQHRIIGEMRAIKSRQHETERPEAEHSRDWEKLLLLQRELIAYDRDVIALYERGASKLGNPNMSKVKLGVAQKIIDDCNALLAKYPRP